VLVSNLRQPSRSGAVTPGTFRRPVQRLLFRVRQWIFVIQETLSTAGWKDEGRKNGSLSQRSSFCAR